LEESVLKNHYYTLAALGTIRLGEKIPVTEEYFLQFAEDTIDAKSYQVLLKSRWGLTEPTGFSFADRILSWEKGLRLELAKARALKLPFDAPLNPEASKGSYNLLEQVRAATALDSPLDAERYLDQLRWSFLEEAGAHHYFDLEALVVYYLKLQLALRQEKFKVELGRDSFKEEYAALADS
jgi:hypothetical protein